MCELFPTTKGDIQIGAFPLNHDCILKVVYNSSGYVNFQYFTCRAQDSGPIVILISKLSPVRKVEVIPVDKF